jgi:DNA helicase-2/ATP-dependent DNA helicase PcrA
MILGMEEGIFPHQRALDDPSELEEERRLCYVGMTRARERLYLYRAERRLRFGTVSERPPSRFLDEIPAHLTRSRPTRRTPPAANGPTLDYAYAQETAWDEGGDGLRAGTRVRHPTFGDGIVRRSEGRGDGEKVSVQFARAGLKKLIRRYANLEIVG